MVGLRGGKGRPAWQLALVGIGAAIAPLDTAVNIAFPAITRGFALEVGDIQWVVIAYVLTYSSLLLAFGRIGDILGHAAIFRLGLAWSTVALLLCAAAPGFGWLLGARVLQGIGAVSDPGQQAARYEEGGARAISVLTARTSGWATWRRRTRRRSSTRSPRASVRRSGARRWSGSPSAGASRPTGRCASG